MLRPDTILLLILLTGCASNVKTVIDIPTIKCQMCEQNIETALKELDGTKEIMIDRTDKSVMVYFDSTKINLTELEVAITKKGYQANDKNPDPEAYRTLDLCCKVPKEE